MTHLSTTASSYFPETVHPGDRLNVLSPDVDPSVLVALFSTAVALQSLALFGVACPPATAPSSPSYPSDRHHLLAPAKRPPFSQMLLASLAIWTDVAWRVVRALLLLDPAPTPSFYWIWIACLRWTGRTGKHGTGARAEGGRARLSVEEVDRLKRANPSLINVWV